MKGKVFLDTNLWIYLYSHDAKAGDIQGLVRKHFNRIVISSQVLSETYHVLVRKGIADKAAAQEIIIDLQESFAVVPITAATVSRAIRQNIRHGYAYWDSLIIAAALENGCTTLFSEDLHHGQLLDKRLTIINPLA